MNNTYPNAPLPETFLPDPESTNDCLSDEVPPVEQAEALCLELHKTGLMLLGTLWSVMIYLSTALLWTPTFPHANRK